jgi:hypothetical protein
MESDRLKDETAGASGLARRDFVKGAGAAGAMMWATPVIRSVRLGTAAGSPPPNTTTTASTDPTTTEAGPTTTSGGGGPTTTGGGGSVTTTTQPTPSSTVQAGQTTSTQAGQTTTTAGSRVLGQQDTPGDGHGGSHGGGILAFTGANVTTITTLGAAALAAGTAIVLATNEDELPGQRRALGDVAEDE